MPCWLPHPLSWGCDLTDPRGCCPPHVHDHDEICLVSGAATTIQHAGADWPCAAGTVFLFRRGEVHGYRNRGPQQPHLWVVHYEADEALYRECPQLAAADPAQRVWSLSAERQAGFRAVFTRMIAESMAAQASGHGAAMSAWMRLLLVQAARWSAPGHEPPGIGGDPELAALWELIIQHVEAPEADFHAALARKVANYDSLRHRFKRVYGRAPSGFRQEARIERAKHLLLETAEPVAEVSQRLGYARQAEFTRAFVRRTGLTPTAFRRNPGWGRTTEGERTTVV